MDYVGESHVITRVLKSKKESKRESKRCFISQTVGVLRDKTLMALKMEKESHEPRNVSNL